MTNPYPLKAEIEQILTNHQRTRFAKVLLGMNSGLSDEETAERRTPKAKLSVPTALPPCAG